MKALGIVGDYYPGMGSHLATVNAIDQALEHLSVNLDARWIPTGSLAGAEYADTLKPYTGIWLAPGSPYRSQQGAHNAIRYAREKGLPFFGT
jgi:CTP synthase (UTP-ammonia lyase)